MKKLATWALGALTASGLAGCLSAPYEPEPTDQTAKVKLAYPAEFCVRGKTREILTEKDDYGYVPAGERINVLIRVRNDKGYCFASASFVPRAGSVYQLDTSIERERCYTNVLLEDKTAPAGVVLEPSRERANYDGVNDACHPTSNKEKARS